MITRLVLVATVLMALGGCSGHATPLADATAVPGGAAVVVSPGGPRLCRMLVESSGVRQLSAALDDLAANGPGGPGSAGLHRATTELRAAAGQVDGQVKAALLDGASALDAVATTGLSKPSAVGTLSQRLDVLGVEVQAVCHFPEGQR